MFAINIIGAGRLGKTIGKLIALNKLGVVQGLRNTSMSSGHAAASFIGEGLAYAEIGDLPPADITFITTPDDQIKKAAQTLSLSSNLKKDSIVIHCSGSLTSAELESLKTKHCHLASIHPMCSFADPSISVNTFANTYCALEGDTKALEIMDLLFRQLGANTYVIKADQKIVYHAAGVIASNYLVTLCAQANRCLEHAGVEGEKALQIILNLMQGTLNNLATTLSPKDALTGPIKRGDVETLAKHQQAFNSNKELLELYNQMGLLTLKLACHNEKIETTLRNLLQSDC